jgi:aconitate hydratase
MSPEYGATIAICPIDDMTLDYLRLTGTDELHVQMVEAYAKSRGLFRGSDAQDAVYTSTLELDLSTVEPSLAGPKRPQDRVSLRQAKVRFQQALDLMLTERKAKPVTSKPGETGSPAAQPAAAAVATATETVPGMEGLDHGAVVVAAITSCTNTSNPSVMIGAGLLARNAVKRGLKGQTVGEDQPRARLADCDGVLQGVGIARVPRGARVQHRRLRAARRASGTAGHCRSRSRASSRKRT